MVSLASVTNRFLTPFSVVDQGQGVVYGIIDEPAQQGGTASTFVPIRHVLRTLSTSQVKTGMVIKSPSGLLFMVGENGPSENAKGTLWNSYKLYQPTGQYAWQTRKRVRDPITTLMQDEGLTDPIMIYAALEPVSQLQFDRGVHVNFEQLTLITNAPVKVDDMVHNRSVSKLDNVLGLSIGTLT